MRSLLIALIIVCGAASAYGLEKHALQMSEDLMPNPPLYDCYMNYYYYVPCPTSSWFWAFTGWPAGEVIGEVFTDGDPSMGKVGSDCPPYSSCLPCCEPALVQFRILDFAGYGTVYPGLCTVRFDVWCADANGCPVGSSLWNSGPKEFCTAGWNYVTVSPALDLAGCYTRILANYRCYPRFLITATHIGTLSKYPAWGFDNISTALGLSCSMHDNGCCPALYPRPQVSHYPMMHSGDYGVAFAHCPPQLFLDGSDTVGNVYGCVELAWRVYVRDMSTCTCCGATEPTTWGAIKAMYK
ncbi:MAG TPA: hypothetical protein VMU02_10065 [bacterium]|nr:hypothetical protein [bacterium]